MLFCWLIGDIIVYDGAVEPLRPFRVLNNPGKKEVPVGDITWSIDSTRLIIINSMVSTDTRL